jgi:hypothetical protein
MWRALSIIKRCSAFTTTLSTKVLQALVWLHLDYCPVVWSGATNITIVPEQVAGLALKCTQRANINNMHVNLNWLVEERLISSLLVFVRSIDMLNAPSCPFELLAHSSDTHAYPTRHTTSEAYSIS